MNRSRALRSALVSAVLVLLGTAAWLTFAPTRVGGATDYVTTHGNSMAPRFHTGDLAVIRPDRYRVGDVVAYRSTLLRTVVLHRIIGRDGDRYVFKGDNNDFVDPTHPNRAQLVGKLWLRVPRAGVILASVRRPLVSGALLGGVALLLLLGAGSQRRRRRREPLAPPRLAPAPTRRPAPVPAVIGGIHLPPPKPPAKAPAPTAVDGVSEPETPVAGRAPVAVSGNTQPADRRAEGVPGGGAGARPSAHAPRIDGHRMLQAAGMAAAVAALAAVTAFATPTTRAATAKAPYTETVKFGYHATPRPGAGPVYPGGALSTGDPVFLKLVDRVSVSVGYRFSTDAPHRRAGSMDVILRVTSPTGWTRDLPLAPATPFDGDRADSEVTIDLARVQRITRQVERLTGIPAGSYSLAVIPRVSAKGKLAGQPLNSDFAPQMTFQLDGVQLRPGDRSLTPTKRSSVAVPHTVANTFSVRGVELPVGTARWIALGGLLLALLGALISRLKRFRRPVAPSGRVHARYGHLLVPIAAVAPHPGRTPIDVTTIDALVALAERGERLILHHHDVDGDTYLVEDGGTLFRFRIAREPAPAPLVLVAA